MPDAPVSSRRAPTHTRRLAAGEIVERDVFVDTLIDMSAPGCGLRYCTLGGGCVIDMPCGDNRFIQSCARCEITDLAALWDWAARIAEDSKAGHLAP